MEMEQQEHLKIARSVRGFLRAPVIAGTYPNESVEVYESSNAENPAVWIKGIECVGSGSRVELTAENAYRFAEQIMALVANHHAGDLRPDDRVTAFVGSEASLTIVPKVAK
jgi:hypothetical protein